jgi:hypothetical protein
LFQVFEKGGQLISLCFGKTAAWIQRGAIMKCGPQWLQGNYEILRQLEKGGCPEND